jgi:hypothetical protein
MTGVARKRHLQCWAPNSGPRSKGCNNNTCIRTHTVHATQRLLRGRRRLGTADHSKPRYLIRQLFHVSICNRSRRCCRLRRVRHCLVSLVSGSTDVVCGCLSVWATVQNVCSERKMRHREISNLVCSAYHTPFCAYHTPWIQTFYYVCEFGKKTVRSIIQSQILHTGIVRSGSGLSHTRMIWSLFLARHHRPAQQVRIVSTASPNCPFKIEGSPHVWSNTLYSMQCTSRWNICLCIQSISCFFCSRSLNWQNTPSCSLCGGRMAGAKVDQFQDRPSSKKTFTEVGKWR